MVYHAHQFMQCNVVRIQQTLEKTPLEQLKIQLQ